MLLDVIIHLTIMFGYLWTFFTYPSLGADWQIFWPGHSVVKQAHDSTLICEKAHR